MTTNAFVGFIPNNEAGNSFLADCQKLLRNSGIVIRRFARNRNRRQFYANYPKGSYHQYRSTLPVKHGTHYGLYLYASKKVKRNLYTTQNYKADYEAHKTALNNSKIVVATVRKIYQLSGVNLNIVNK